MIRVTRAQLQPIGLDVGHECVKMIQLEQAGDTLTVAAAAKALLPPEARVPSPRRAAAVADVVRQMLRRHPFKGRRVVAALPRETVHVRHLRLPAGPATDADVARLVRAEAATAAFPFDLADAQLAHIPAGEVRQGADVRQEVIVFAARNADVGEFLELLHAGGAVVESLDVEACALYRTVDKFVRRRADELEVNVLVDVGAHRTQVVIGRGRELSFLKPIDVAGRHFNDAVSRKLGITADEAQALRRRLSDPSDAPDPAARRDPVRQAACDATRGLMDDLAREVALCLRYFSVTFRGQRPTRLRLVGGEASDPQLQQLLGAALPLPVEVGRPLASVDTSRMGALERRGTMSEWAVAFGLGLKRVTGTFGPRDGRSRDAAAKAADAEAVLVDAPPAAATGGAASTVPTPAATRDFYEPAPARAEGGTAAPAAASPGEALHA